MIDRCRCDQVRIAWACDAPVHECSCALFPIGGCRKQGGGHKCVCSRYGPSVRCLGENHVCSCLGGPKPCLARERHRCSCVPYGWRSCRAWGSHDDGRAKARDVRALVVTSYGSAPSAKTIDSPVLRGFAGLPHQLKLCVAEIAWVVMAAADDGAEND